MSLDYADILFFVLSKYNIVYKLTSLYSKWDKYTKYILSKRTISLSNIEKIITFMAHCDTFGKRVYRI